MQTIGIGELQKNMGILTHLTEALTIVDKRKNKEIAIVYPMQGQQKKSVVDELAGKFNKYAKNVDVNKPFDQIKEEAMMEAMKEKYDFLD
ncbi:MAG: hypothetical protein COA92_01225 [Sulfurovum sp.]|nr:MAG: hypothetical protein COA92_01225 [Sulfurovum sp.]